MPIPDLSFNNPLLGLPSQRVPLRYAYFMTGLTLGEFLSLLIDPVDEYQDSDGVSFAIYLQAYEYAGAKQPRDVRPITYETLRREAEAGKSSRQDLLKRIPPTHFVWSKDLADVFSRFKEKLTDQPYARFSFLEDFHWNPALLGMDALIEECVDLSDVAVEKPVTGLSRRELRKQETQRLYGLWQQAYLTKKAEHPDKSNVWIARQIKGLPIGKEHDVETIRKNMVRK
jgi:hypothetical protein